MHSKAVFTEDEMVSLGPPTAHLHDALMNLSCGTLTGACSKGSRQRTERSWPLLNFLKFLNSH